MIDATKLLEPQVASRMMLASSDFAIAAVDAVEPITLQQAKEHLRVVFDDEDAYITSLIVAARQMAEGKLNRTITQRTREQAFSCFWNIKLLKPPFISVESVSYFTEDDQEIAVTDYRVSSLTEPTKIYMKTGFSAPDMAARPDAVLVRYTAGYPVGEVPYPIIQWMLLQIGSMYEHRESVIAGVSVAPLPEMYEKLMLQQFMVYE